MVTWEWLVQRRGIAIDDVVRSGVDTHEAMQKYFQVRGATSPTEAEFNAAFLRVNPSVLEPLQQPVVSKTVRKKAPIRKSRKKKAT
jgi:hypothetical protein